MAAFFIFVLCFIVFHPQLLPANPISSFSIQKFDKVSNFESQFALFGDAFVVSNGSAVQLTNSVSSSAGRVMYKKPVKFAQGKPVKSVSFSSSLSFKITPENGSGFAFVMVPGGINASGFNPSGGSQIVSVKFDNKCVKAINASSDNNLLSSGKRLNAFIDYEASSKRLELRLSPFRESKPIDPLLSYSIDLAKLWKDKAVHLGLSSSNGKYSSVACLIYSWSFQVRGVPPHWMHSQPLDPETVGENAKAADVVVVHKQSGCVLRVIGAMIFGTACGASGAFMVLYLWAMVGKRRPVVPEECSAVDFNEYKKVKVVVEKAVEDDGIGKQ